MEGFKKVKRDIPECWLCPYIELAVYVCFVISILWILKDAGVIK